MTLQEMNRDHGSNTADQLMDQMMSFVIVKGFLLQFDISI